VAYEKTEKIRAKTEKKNRNLAASYGDDASGNKLWLTVNVDIDGNGPGGPELASMLAADVLTKADQDALEAMLATAYTAALVKLGFKQEA